MADWNDPRDAENRRELATLIGAIATKDGVTEPVPGIKLTRSTEQPESVHGVLQPCLCVVAQGAKEIYLGESRYRYDCEHYMLATVELPVTGRVTVASREEPYLSLRLDLDPALVGSVMVESGLPAPRGSSEGKAVVVSRLGSELLDSTLRLVRLLARPEEAKVLMPLVKREIVFRLLVGEQGNRLRQLAKLGSHTDRIAQAVERLRVDFRRPLRIDSLARELGMSPSGFHHHFRVVTDMSPLQFQKQIRLQEARRLMLGESLDAASAGYRVGYEDPSHFSRDYKRLFGNSPIRDVEKLRTMVLTE